MKMNPKMKAKLKAKIMPEEKGEKYETPAMEKSEKKGKKGKKVVNLKAIA
jgi:hypothetical protein